MRRWQQGQFYAATCVEVYDGDTIRVRWTCAGLDGSDPTRIRLARIDAAEMRPFPTQQAVTARLHLAGLCEGKSILVFPRRAWPDPYGRIIADVHVDGIDISTELLRRGVVTRWRNARQRAARAALRGIR